VPEVWINVARWTVIDELKLTPRDINDYNALMKRRLEILRQHGITINDIQKVISLLELMPGAMDFINWLHKKAQMIIVSDTFRDSLIPFGEDGWPVCSATTLPLTKNGFITDFKSQAN
jgi:phosphoserine/homoserine phosphotransferase